MLTTTAIAEQQSQSEEFERVGELQIVRLEKTT
jgi:hypothetical protein